MISKPVKQLFFKRIALHQKNWYGKWHAWMGIFAGSILIVVTLTGALLSFEPELDMWFYPELFSFEEKEQLVPMDEAFEKAIALHPEWNAFGITRIFERKDAYYVKYKVGEEFWHAVVDPYTAEVKGTRAYDNTIMGTVRKLHRTLLVPTIGKYIVGIASLFMIILMITGLRLWIPQQWKYLKESLTVKKRAGFKRQNYDLHRSLGFYFSPFITLSAFTGLAITFLPIIVLTLFLVDFQSPKSIGEVLGKKSNYIEGKESVPINNVIELAKKEMPESVVRGFSIPNDSTGAYSVDFVSPNETKTGDFSFVSLDQYSGEILLNSATDFPNIGKLPLSWMLPIHFGTFGGLPTRILMMLSALAASVLFISGFIIWWGRWKKAKGSNLLPDESSAEKTYVLEEPELEKELKANSVPKKELIENEQ